MKSLEELLRMHTPIDHELVGQLSFTVSVRSKDADSVHFLIHADGCDSDTLDFRVRGNVLWPLTG